MVCTRLRKSRLAGEDGHPHLVGGDAQRRGEQEQSLDGIVTHGLVEVECRTGGKPQQIDIVDHHDIFLDIDLYVLVDTDSAGNQVLVQ